MLDERNRYDVAWLSPGAARRGLVDGLIVGREVWLLVGRPGEGLRELLWSGADAGAVPLRLCRGLLHDGRVLLGDHDPIEDRLLSEAEELD